MADISMKHHCNENQHYLETDKEVDYHSGWKQHFPGKVNGEINRGSYAAVYKARREDKRPCAIKKPHPHILSFQRSLESYEIEIHLHSTLKHPSIVGFYGVCHIENNLPPLLIMEKMWISLYSFIDQKLLSNFKLSLKLQILLDVAKGLSYLHERNIIHRDVTLSNILLNTEFIAKLSDFGGAQHLDTTECNYERCSVPGNPLYMPLESFSSNPICGLHLDVFSFGCIMPSIINEIIPGREDHFSKQSVAEKYLNNMPKEQCLLKRLAACCLACIPEHRPDIKCVIASLNTIASSVSVMAESEQQPQMQHAPGVKKGDINNAKVASRKRLKMLEEHGDSKAAMRYEILVTSDAILNFLRDNTPASGQRTNWLLNLASNFDHALIEAYQTYLEKYLYSAKPCFLNISSLSANTVANPPTAAITTAHVTYHVVFSQSTTKVSFTRKQVITVSTLTKGNTSTIPKVFNVLLLKSSSDEPYSHIPFGERQSFQGNNGESKHQLLSTRSHCKEAVPCIQQYDLVREPLLEELFTNNHENSILRNSTRYTKLACSRSYIISSAAEESSPVSNAKISQYPNEIYSSCVDITEIVFSLSDGGSVSSVNTELAVPHAHNIASANLPFSNAKPFEYFGFTTVPVAQRYDASNLFCYQCYLYVCYHNSAWVIVTYQTTFKHTGKLFYTSGFYSAHYRADGAQKFWFAPYTECTTYEAPNIDSMYAYKALDANVQHRSTHSNACWVNKLEFTKPKQSSMILESLCADSVLCLHERALFGQPSSKVLSDFNSNLTSHHLSNTSLFNCNQEQKPIYAMTTQHNLEVSYLDGYDLMNQCSVSVAGDDGSTVNVLNFPLCQHKQPYIVLLPYINCTPAGELSTKGVTKHYSTLTCSDINKQQTTASFRRNSNSVSTQLYTYHYHSTHKIYYKGFYYCISFYVSFTMQKQVVLSTRCSLHLCKGIYHNTQPVITLHCTCKPIYHQLCNAALCSGVAVVNSLQNGLLCLFESYYFPKRQSTISTTNAQASVLEVPMLGMQDISLSKDTCFNETALANSCTINTTDMHFKWHCTLPAEAIQDISNVSKKAMGRYGNSMNLPFSVGFDGKESSSQEAILKIKAPWINFNTTSVPAKNNNDTALNAKRNLVPKAFRKHGVMKCFTEVDEWLFLHTGKGCSNAFSLTLLLRLLPMPGNEWLHKSLLAAESCKSCFNQPTLARNVVITFHFQVTLCTDHESTKAMENFHHSIGQCYTHASMLTPLLELLQYEHKHFATQCVQVDLCQPYNTSVQTITLISATRCVNQLYTLFIAYNSQIGGSIIAEKLSLTYKISQIDAQQKESDWFGVSRIMPETSCTNDCITKSIILCQSVDLQLAGAPTDNVHQLNSAAIASIDQVTCCVTRSLKNGTSSTVRDNMLKTMKQVLLSRQDEQSALISITCNETRPTLSYVVKKHLYFGPTMLLAGTCMPFPGQNAAICAMTKGTHSDQDEDHDTGDKQNNSKHVSLRKGKSCSNQQSKQSRCNRSREVRRRKEDNNGSDRNHDDDNHDKKHEFTPTELTFSSFLVVFIILLLLCIHLIWLCLPGRLLLQHTTEKHSCSDVTFNSQLLNMYSKSMCQVIAPGWTDYKCYYKSHSRPSFRVTNATTAVQVLPQDNLHFCKRQISIPNSKALASVSPQHGFGVLHKSRLMIIIKRKSHRMLTKNSGIVTSQCTAAAVSIIYTYSGAPDHYDNDDFDLTYLLLMLQPQILYEVLYYYVYTALIIWYLWHTFGYCNDVVAFEIRSKEKRYPLSRVVLIDRMAYHSYPTVKLKSQFPSEVVLEYFHGRLYLCTHYEPLNPYSNHFLLQNLDIDIAHCQVIASISTGKRLYLISHRKGLILLQQWLVNFLYILRDSIVMLTSYCVMNYHARNAAANKLHDAKGERIYYIYTLQLMGSDVINRILFSRTHRCIFHIEATHNAPRLSILEMYSPITQWLTNSSGHDRRIPYQSINDCACFKRLLYSDNHIVISQLPNEPATISCCLQESAVDASESQHSVLHLTNTIKTVHIENRIDMFRPIGKLVSGCTIGYYPNQGTDGMDTFEAWELVTGNVTLYHASGNQTFQNEHHHHAIINGNNVNPIVNFGVEGLQNVDAFMPPKKEVDLDDDLHEDNLIVSLLMIKCITVTR